MHNKMKRCKRLKRLIKSVMIAFTETVQLITLFQWSCDTETIAPENRFLVLGYMVRVHLNMYFSTDGNVTFYFKLFLFIWNY